MDPGLVEYKIPSHETDRFIANATRYYPGVVWAIICGDTTVKSRDIGYALAKLNPAETDTLTFVGEVGNEFAFWNALPRMRPCEVSREVRQKFSRRAQEIANRTYVVQELARDADEQPFDWTVVPQFMTLIHEVTPIVSYYAIPSQNKIIYEEKREDSHCCVASINVVFWMTGPSPRIVFRLDDGFASVRTYGDNGGAPVPLELAEAFRQWVANGRIGAVLE